jgi:5-methylcytosine-specific restriction enzyme subunit McrC
MAPRAVERIVLREHQHLSRHDVGAAGWEALARLERANRRVHGRTVLDWLGPDRVQATSVVGVVHVPGLVLEIVPKIDDGGLGREPDGATDAQRCLVGMLRRAGWIDHRVLDDTGLEHGSLPLLDLHAHQFCVALAREFARGVDRSYRTVEETLVCLRGRLLMARQMRHDAFVQGHFHVQHDAFTEDTDLNRTLKAGLRVLERCVRTPSVAAEVARLLSELDGVADEAPPVVLRRTPVYDLGRARFRSLVEFARRLLGGATPTLHSGGEGSFALLVPMEELFVTVRQTPSGARATVRDAARHGPPSNDPSLARAA